MWNIIIKDLVKVDVAVAGWNEMVQSHPISMKMFFFVRGLDQGPQGSIRNLTVNAATQ